MTQPPPLPAARKRPEWVAILTTLAYPGTGQFLQGRRTVGTILTTITTLVFLWGVYSIFRGFLEGMKEALNGGKDDLFACARYVLLPTKALGLCYLVAFLDAVFAHWRIKRRVG